MSSFTKELGKNITLDIDNNKQVHNDEKIIDDFDVENCIDDPDEISDILDDNEFNNDKCFIQPDEQQSNTSELCDINIETKEQQKNMDNADVNTKQNTITPVKQLHIDDVPINKIVKNINVQPTIPHNTTHVVVPKRDNQQNIIEQRLSKPPNIAKPTNIVKQSNVKMPNTNQQLKKKVSFNISPQQTQQMIETTKTLFESINLPKSTILFTVMLLCIGIIYQFILRKKLFNV